MPPKPGNDGQTTHGICDPCAEALLAEAGVPLEDYLDSLDVPVLVVDSDVAAAYANREARQLTRRSLAELVGMRAGDVFDCSHRSLPGGCGRTIHCSGCALRQCFQSSHATGYPHFMVPATLSLYDPDHPSAVTLTITTVKRGDAVLLLLNRVE